MMRMVPKVARKIHRAHGSGTTPQTIIAQSLVCLPAPSGQLRRTLVEEPDVRRAWKGDDESGETSFHKGEETMAPWPKFLSWKRQN